MSVGAGGGRQLLVVGSYGSADAATIHVCAVDESSGALGVVASAGGLANPSFLAVSPGGEHLYAVSETGAGSDGAPGRVAAFRLTGRVDSVELAPLNHQLSGGDHPCHLSIDPDGKWLAVANYGSGSVAILPIRPDGSLGEMASLVRHAGAGAHPHRQDGPHVHSTTFMPGGRFLVAADLGIDRLLVHAFDPQTGSVTAHGEAKTRPGAGPRHLAVHPDRTHVFVVNELDNTVTTYVWGAAGVLDEVATLPTLPPNAPESIAADVAVAADGRYVYVSNRGHDSIAVFAFGHGRVSSLGIYPSGGAWPRSIGLTAGGGYLLSANQHSGRLAVLPLRSGGAVVGDRVDQVGITRPTCVVLVERDE